MILGVSLDCDSFCYTLSVIALYNEA